MANPNTSPADLNQRIAIQSFSIAPDGAGGMPKTWNTEATVWAAIWPVSANEQIAAMGQTMTVTHRIRIRYRSILRSGWRIVHRGKNYNIVSITESNMARRWLDLMVKEAA